MVKSIIGILIGVAISERAISSVDDKPQACVPGLNGVGSTRSLDQKAAARGDVRLKDS